MFIASSRVSLIKAKFREMQLSSIQLFSIISFLAFGVIAQLQVLKITSLSHFGRYTNTSMSVISKIVHGTSNSINIRPLETSVVSVNSSASNTKSYPLSSLINASSPSSSLALTITTTLSQQGYDFSGASSNTLTPRILQSCNLLTSSSESTLIERVDALGSSVNSQNSNPATVVSTTHPNLSATVASNVTEDANGSDDVYNSNKLIATLSTHINSAVIYSSDILLNSVTVSQIASTKTQSVESSTGLSIIPIVGKSTRVFALTQTVNAVVSTGFSLVLFGGNLASCTPVTGTDAFIKTEGAVVSTGESLSEIIGTSIALSTMTVIATKDSTKLLTITSCSETLCYPISTKSVFATEADLSASPKETIEVVVSANSSSEGGMTEAKTQINSITQQPLSLTSTIKTVNIASETISTQPAISIYRDAAILINSQSIVPLAFVLSILFI